MRFMLCATPSYLARHPGPRSPLELTQHNCIVYSTNARNEWIFKGPQGEQVVRVKGNYRANSADGVVQGTLLGLGIAVVPSMAAAEHLRAGRLIRLLPQYKLPEKTLYAAYLPNPTMAQCVQTFVRFLIDEFEHPSWDEALEPVLASSHATAARSAATVP
jgi:DNA-binding transcriptional LysR family regulator